MLINKTSYHSVTAIRLVSVCLYAINFRYSGISKMYVTLIHHNEVDKRHAVILTFASKVNCAEDMARRGVENMIMRTCRRGE